jgi:hypothetical protein
VILPILKSVVQTRRLPPITPGCIKGEARRGAESSRCSAPVGRASPMPRKELAQALRSRRAEEVFGRTLLTPARPQ